MRPVAGAEPTTKITSAVANGNAAKVGANPYHYQPRTSIGTLCATKWRQGTVFIGSRQFFLRVCIARNRVDKLAHLNAACGCDLFFVPMPDENWLTKK